jgi:hypothetical protein
VSDIKVHTIDWGDYLVRGTDDVALAQAAVRDHLIHHVAEWERLASEEAQEVIDRRHVDTGWWRCNPCICGEGHSFDMGKAPGPGRGNFRGVYFWC